MEAKTQAAHARRFLVVNGGEVNAMKSLIYSRHAAQRMQQRGVRKRDVELVRRCGTRIDDRSLLLTKRDAEREIALRKREIQALERLRGCKLVLGEEVVVTLYHATVKQQKAAMRRFR